MNEPTEIFLTSVSGPTLSMAAIEQCWSRKKYGENIVEIESLLKDKLIN